MEDDLNFDLEMKDDLNSFQMEWNYISIVW
jgi:hypothetical protein